MNKPIQLEKFPMPNVRSMFVPDPGYVIADIDLDRADAQVVAWDAGDEGLKQIFREGLDVHMENAKTVWGPNATKEHRQLAKGLVHATNYVGSPYALSRNFGITVAEAERFQKTWFAAHPAIKEWHKRIEHQLFTTREVRTAFGNRRFYFDRVSDLLKEAVAWIPQATVGLVINRGWDNIDEYMPEVNVLLQVHDSLVVQIPKNLYPSILPDIRDNMLIEVPYDDPLIIPVGIKVSENSWGECQEVHWETGELKKK